MPLRFSLATLLFLTSTLLAQTHIDLTSLGYREPSTGERLTDEASASLDFVDASHILLTFNPKKLLTRVPGCPPTHDDHMIHATILEVPSGKVVNEADWYLHDNRRYLWPLGSGKFLLRKLNSVYQIDSSLNEKLLLASGKDISWLTVSADGKQIILETQDAPNSQQAKPRFVLQFLSLDSLTPQQTIESGGLVHLNGNGSGYADALRKGDVWLVRFGPTATQRKNIARVKSGCAPEVVYSSTNSLLIGRCPPNSTDYSVTAFTTAGRRLWAQHWTRKRFSPAAIRSDDNRRFVVTSFSVADWDRKTPYSTENETDANHHLEQNIQIFDTASGNSIQTLTANPVVVSGQNFTLSPDSMQFAVLHNSQIDLYQLPKISDDEQAKFAALKADSPGLYIVSKVDSDGDEVDEQAANLPPVPTPGGESAAKPEEVKAEESPAVFADPSSEPLTTFKASIQVVSVDVVVTDSKDHPVKGLKPGDFAVAEDGKPQTVRSFHESAEDDSAPPVVTTAKNPVPGIFSNDRQATVSGSVTVILLDFLNTPALDQQWARKGLLKFLGSRTKPKNSQFALCTLSQRTHLRMIQGFTRDENMLLASVNNKKKTNVQQGRWQTATSGTQSALDNLQELGRGDPMNGFEGLIHAMERAQAEEHVNDTDSRVGITLDAMAQLAKYLSGIPGRKNLVWLSGSFPISLFAVPENGDQAADTRNYSDKLKIVGNLLGQAHVAVYPVDVRGLDSNVTAANNTNTTRLGAVTPLAPGTLETTGNLDPTQQRGLRQLSDIGAEWGTLNQLAADTGGKAFMGSNGIDNALSTAIEQGANYYSLSYTPTDHNYNSKFRKIKLNLAQKGYHLHYRPGYFADDPHAPLKDSSHSTRAAAMQHGSPESHEVRFVARVVPVGTKAKVDSAQAGKVYLAAFKDQKLPANIEMQRHSLDFAIDSADLRFTPTPNDLRRCVLNFMISSFDDEGRQLSGVAIVWTSDLKPEDYKNVMAGGVRIHQEVDIPVASTAIRLGVEDDVTSRLGTLELPLPVAAPADMPHLAKHSLPEIEPD
jgi:VWFA-related protein